MENAKQNELINQIKAIADEVAKSRGAEIVEVNFSYSYKKLNLNVFVYSQSGVDLDMLETFHNDLSGRLDALDDRFDADYILNVSSPGLDRPIVTDDDYRRALGKEIELILRAPVDGENKPRGVLISYSEQSVELETVKNKAKTLKNFDRENIKKAQLFVKF
jgi:ribosome maturation factor RimP